MAETEKPKCFQKFSCYSSETLYRHRKSTTPSVPENNFPHNGQASKITPKKGLFGLKKRRNTLFRHRFITQPAFMAWQTG